MRAADIRGHFASYSIAEKRTTTIRPAFASALAPTELYDVDRVRRALTLLGQENLESLACVYCDAAAETWDHLQSLVRNKKPSGFGHTLGNLVPSCRACNSAKGSKPWESWMTARGISAERIALVRRYHETYLEAPQPISQRCLTQEQTQRLNAVEEQIVALMIEADALLADARRAAALI
jgi:hypothetical protein